MERPQPAANTPYDLKPRPESVPRSYPAKYHLDRAMLARGRALHGGRRAFNCAMLSTGWTQAPPRHR